MARFEGKCPRCGKIHYASRKGETVICDCWRICPVCGAEMEQFTPKVSPVAYGADGKHELRTMMVCNLHYPPFYSTQKPVEVACT
ncbi:MAG: hypothetical protein ACPLZY_02280 [Candidatus Norongarragalinales archaeon]